MPSGLLRLPEPHQPTCKPSCLATTINLFSPPPVRRHVCVCVCVCVFVCVCVCDSASGLHSSPFIIKKELILRFQQP
jgi:hypothetical protein